MLLREGGAPSSSLARPSERVKLLWRNCAHRPSGRSSRSAAREPGVGRRLAIGVLLASMACHLRPPVLERARLLAEHGRAPEAISLLEERVAADPTDVAASRQLIRLYGSVGRIDRANAQTERLAEVLPRDSPIPWLELGHAYELVHHYEEALSAYDRASRVAPLDALGPKIGGLRAARWGELGLAEPRLEEAVRRTPRDEEAVRRTPRDAECWHALGLVRLGLGKLEAARQAYANGLSANSGALENHLGLATVALRMNQPERALAAYDSLLSERPTFTPALLGKSWALILLGRLEAAEAVLEQAQARGAASDSIQRQRVAIRDRKAQLPQKNRGTTPP
jgi:tetratricopeptide (TPR) repeat protein